MTDHRRLCLGTMIAVGAAIFTFVPPVAADGSGAVVRSVEPPSVTSVPSSPEVTQPDTTEPATAEPADELDVTSVTIVGILAVALLIVVASWWMVQRRDDDAPHPRRLDPDEPLPGQDLL